MAFTRQSFRLNNSELVFTHSIYVSPNGSDINGNGTSDSPYNTIQYASSKVTNDTTVVVLLPGIYNENPFNNDALNKESSIYMNVSTSNGGYNKRKCAPGIVNALFTSSAYTMTFVGYNNQTIINSIFTQKNSAIVAAGPNKSVNVYNMVINVECKVNAVDSNVFIAGGSEMKASNTYNCCFNYINNFTYDRGVFHTGYNSATCYAYNCIFNMGDVANAYSGARHSSMYAQYDTINTYYGQHSWGSWVSMNFPAESQIKSPLNANNCIFINLQNWNGIRQSSTDYTGAFIVANNCIYPNISSNFYGNLTAVNSIKDDMKLDEDYYPLQTLAWKNTGVASIKDIDTNQSSIGLYGGPYSWQKIVSLPAVINIEEYYKSINKNENDTYNFSIIPPDSIDVLKLDEIFSGNFLDDSSICYSQLIDKQTWASMKRIEIL